MLSILKNNRETASIPIILLTAYAMASERQSLLTNSQANKFFAKPINDYNALIKAIEQLVNDEILIKY